VAVRAHNNAFPGFGALRRQRLDDPIGPDRHPFLAGVE
jgi:hypothetical protein